MKTIIITIFIAFTLNAQNVWYVDRNATGANTGRSWADAWNSLDSSIWLGNIGVNWAIIGDGDTIYVSGGTDSTRYYPIGENRNNGVLRRTVDGDVVRTFNQTVVVKRAWQSGHNGEVYFTPRNDQTYMIFNVEGVNNVTFSGFNFYDTRTNNTQQLNGLIHIYDSNNTLENCFIYNRGLTGGVYISGTNLTLRGCTFEYENNDLDNDSDPIGMAGGTGGHIIEQCTFILRNTSMTTNAHRDIIQISNVGNVSTNDVTVDMIVRNNIILMPTQGIGWNSVVYSSGMWTNVNFYIYNNIVAVNNTTNNLGIIFAYQGQQPPDFPFWTISYYIFGNTFIFKDDGTGLTTPITLASDPSIDTLYLKNNIIVADEPINIFLNFRAFYYGIYYRKVDYNAYFKKGGLSTGLFYTGEGFGGDTYAVWRSYPYNYDAHSLSGNNTDINFVSRYGDNITDYYTTTGRGVGENIANDRPDLLAKFPDVGYDILGNPRGDNWDMGALQFQSGGGQPNNVNLQSKVFLQGPFNQTSMKTNLSLNGLLPNAQPFNTAPWNYNGNETLGSGSTSSYVDWVLVELRSSTNPSQVVSRKAAILKNDGTLLNANGSSGVPFSNVQAGAYYVAVFHRNHLAVMSAAPVMLSANSQIYDFTTSMNKAYGTNPMKDLGNGKFGMFAGDGNGDGGITIADRNEIWLPQNGTMGYQSGDFNLDGGVTVGDVNLYWNLNNGIMTSVP